MKMYIKTKVTLALIVTAAYFLIAIAGYQWASAAEVQFTEDTCDIAANKVFVARMNQGDSAIEAQANADAARQWCEKIAEPQKTRSIIDKCDTISDEEFQNQLSRGMSTIIASDMAQMAKDTCTTNRLMNRVALCMAAGSLATVQLQDTDPEQAEIYKQDAIKYVAIFHETWPDQDVRRYLYHWIGNITKQIEEGTKSDVDVITTAHECMAAWESVDE